MKETQLILQEAKAAVRLLNGLTTEKKNEAMEKMAAALIRHTEHILAENAVDMEKAQGVIAPVMLDRLLLTKERIEGMAQGILDVLNVTRDGIFGYLSLWSGKTVSAIVVIIFASVYTVYSVMYRLLRSTPGDLIYDR